MEEELERIKFSEVAAALKDTDHPFPPRLLRGFSDLFPRDIKEFMPIWQDATITRKISLLEDLEEITEKDTLVCFDEVAKAVINDLDPRVRVLSIRLLWECEDPKLVPTLIELMLEDIDEGVRSTAASLLGHFVYLGELEEIPDLVKISAVKNLLDVVLSEEVSQVRMRALESLGYSSHPKVPALIKAAYDSKENLWVACALCAMGRSADDQWSEFVQEKLDSNDSDIKFEAARAAGELEIATALDQLFTMVEEEDFDSEIRLAAIWSLSQIGGREVKDKLQELLKDSDSEEEIEWLEKALENLEISSSSDGLNFLNFSPKGDVDEEDDLDDLDELDEDDEFGDVDFDSLEEDDDDDDDEEDE
ncbi:MAG: HEAT repeat domain-containing protein [Anaerolineaceae bacterium]